MKQSFQGRAIGGALLVAGSCIGAAMLGLPIITGSVGFVPSCFLLAFTWILMVCTGLLLLEVNLWLGDRVSITTMAAKTLGSWGQIVSGVLFAFLFYSLLVAYISGSGALFSEMLHDWAGYSIGASWGSAFFSVLFGLFIYAGVGAVDAFNRGLMLGLLLTYGLLVFMGVHHVTGEHLMRRDWGGSLGVLPAMVISFGFHNLIPSLTGYLKSDEKQLGRVVVWGSLIPLFLYILWQWLILGIINWDVSGPDGNSSELATQALRQAIGGSWIVNVAEAFAFFAIVTSFLGVALSMLDFLADWFSVAKGQCSRGLLTLAVILPPFIFAFTYPGAFLLALKYAGALGAAVIFGVLPPVMVWRGRYILKFEGKQMLPGGKAMLLLVGAAALVVVSSVLF